METSHFNPFYLRETRGFKQEEVFLPGLSLPLIVKQKLVTFTFFYRITMTSHFQPCAEGQRLVIFSLSILWQRLIAFFHQK